MQKVSIVIPIFNEEENIVELYRRIRLALDRDFIDFIHQILFIDDGSVDLSFSFLKALQKNDPSVNIIRFSRNFGHHLAISAGLDNAVGDFIFTMDGDLQDSPDDMIHLYNKLIMGYDVVYAERQNKKFSFFKKITSKIFIYIMRFLVAEDIVMNTDIFRVMTRQVVDEVKKMRESNRYILGLVGWVGFTHVGVPVEHSERFKGQTKYSISKLFKLALDAIFSFSNYPIKLITRLGFILVAFSTVMGFMVIYRKIVYGSSIAGWASIITSIFFISGIQISMLGIIGEYIGRIYMEVKNRPLYVIKESYLMGSNEFTRHNSKKDIEK